MKLAFISINPKYANKIKKGIKKWEYRRIHITNYKQIYLYEFKPICKITLKLYISQYIKDSPEKIWELTKDNSGISKKQFFNYCKKKKYIYAYKIEKFEKVNYNLQDNNLKIPHYVLYIEDNLK